MFVGFEHSSTNLKESFILIYLIQARRRHYIENPRNSGRVLLIRFDGGGGGLGRPLGTS